MKKNLLISVLLFLVIGLSLALFKKIKQSENKPEILPTPTKQLIGRDKDEHGCLIAAGYSWCEAKQKCLRIWEEPCEAVTAAPTTDETEILKSAIKKALIAKHGSSANELKISVSKILGNYAQGGASGEGGGGMWFGAKVNGQWQLVWDGNGTILCSDLADYPQFPTAMISECYDQASGKSVTR